MKFLNQIALFSVITACCIIQIPLLAQEPLRHKTKTVDSSNFQILNSSLTPFNEPIKITTNPTIIDISHYMDCAEFKSARASFGFELSQSGCRILLSKTKNAPPLGEFTILAKDGSYKIPIFNRHFINYHYEFIAPHDSVQSVVLRGELGGLQSREIELKHEPATKNWHTELSLYPDSYPFELSIDGESPMHVEQGDSIRTKTGRFIPILKVGEPYSIQASIRLGIDRHPGVISILTEGDIKSITVYHHGKKLKHKRDQKQIIISIPEEINHEEYDAIFVYGSTYTDLVAPLRVDLSYGVIK